MVIFSKNNNKISPFLSLYYHGYIAMVISALGPPVADHEAPAVPPQPESGLLPPPQAFPTMPATLLVHGQDIPT